MSGELDHITKTFTHRMALRRGMMRKLGISDRPDLAEALAAPIRTTLLACNRCTQPELCAYWVTSDTNDAPMFCCARLAFEELAHATACPPSDRAGTPNTRQATH